MQQLSEAEIWREMKQNQRNNRELYWPSMVLRKWLNRRSDHTDFSADERESESDVDEEVDWEQELICVGTWNVGGRLPPEDLDISDWLDVEEPADIYVLGLQEIVPLNAGNIFGAEDNRPVPKWEYIIRETLNKIQPVRKKYKFHSNPPSPSRFKPADDVPVIEEILLATDSDSEEEVHPVDEESFNFNIEEDGSTPGLKQSRFYEEAHRLGDKNSEAHSSNETDMERQSSAKRLDRLHCLRLTDHNADSETSVAQTKVLTRMLSGSERIGLMWPEQPLDLLSQRGLDKLSSFKSMSSFKSSKSFKLSTRAENSGQSDTIFIPDLNLESIMNKRRSPYVRIVSKQMVGIFLSIWVRRSLRKHIQNLKVCAVGVGVMGYIGNKGRKKGMNFGEMLMSKKYIVGHNSILFMVGDFLKQYMIMRDLNYRINLSYDETKQFISKKDWSGLSEKDQLIRELRKGRAFDGWSEGTLTFPPTYKYEFDSENYVGEDPKAGRRTPAWCDRILSFGKDMRLLKYRRVEQRLSDHRPVTATYMAEVEVFSHKRLQRALTFTDAELEGGVDIREVDMDVSMSRSKHGECMGGACLLSTFLL
ncbi:Type I inositol 1,4,5-trisphosphate 5-phosphatase [Asimina triloba]